MLQTAKQALQATDFAGTAQLHQLYWERDFCSYKTSFLMYKTGLCKYEYTYILNEVKDLQKHLEN